MKGLDDYKNGYHYLDENQPSLALLEFQKSAEQGFLPSILWLHYFYQYGYYTLLNIPNLQEQEKALNNLIKSIDKEHLAWLKSQETSQQPYIFFSLGYLYLHGILVKKDHETALNYFNKIQAKQTLFIQHLLSESLIKLHRFKETKKILYDILTKEATHGSIFFSLGFIYYLNKNDKKAQPILLNALILEPKLLPARKYLIDILYRNQHYQQTLEHIQQYLVLHPKDPWIWTRKAKIYFKTHLYEKALYCLEIADKLDPADHNSYLKKRKSVIQSYEVQCQKTHNQGSALYHLEQTFTKRHSTLDIRGFTYDSRLIHTLLRHLQESTNPYRFLYLDIITDSELAALFQAIKMGQAITTLTYDSKLLTEQSQPIRAKIPTYLQRNQLLQKNKIASKELTHLLWEHLDGMELRETLQKIMKKHPYLRKLDFSQQGIHDNHHLLSPKNYPVHTQVTHLDFSHNKIGNEGVKKLGLLLKTTPLLFPHLTQVNLANNKIGDIGFRAILDMIVPKENQDRLKHRLKLTHINLDNNYISNINLTDHSLSKALRLESWEVTISLTNNMIWSHDQKQTSMRQLSCPLYQSKPVCVKSFIYADIEHLISKDHHLLFLVKSKNMNPLEHHVMLYLEGMSQEGQHYVIRYHILSPQPKKAYVQIEERHYQHLQEDTIKFNFIRTYPVTKKQADTLHFNIHRQKDQALPFAKLSSTDGTTQNCLLWCLSHLRKIGIHEQVPFYGAPCFFPSDQPRIPYSRPHEAKHDQDKKLLFNRSIH